jgi:hypothetical protein
VPFSFPHVGWASRQEDPTAASSVDIKVLICASSSKLTWALEISARRLSVYYSLFSERLETQAGRNVFIHTQEDAADSCEPMGATTHANRHARSALMRAMQTAFAQGADRAIVHDSEQLSAPRWPLHGHSRQAAQATLCRWPVFSC